MMFSRRWNRLSTQNRIAVSFVTALFILLFVAVIALTR